MIVEHVRPEIDGGRFPIKRTIGERVDVTADIFADGHDVVAARASRSSDIQPQRPQRRENVSQRVGLPSELASDIWSSAVTRRVARDADALVAQGSDEWTASFDTAEIGWHEYAIVAWVDRFRPGAATSRRRRRRTRTSRSNCSKGRCSCAKRRAAPDTVGAAQPMRTGCSHVPTHSATRRRSTNA